MKLPRLPNRTQRTLIVGRTGTGKTVAALWHLSNYDLENQAWILVNFKNDEHINSIPNARFIDYDFFPRRKSEKGIFILNSLPQDAVRPKPQEPSILESYLWKIWNQEQLGFMCDEAYMLGDNEAFNAILTQGRSKKIPVLICSQRPVWISRFCFSESSFFQVFHLNDVRDRKTIEGFVPLEDWELGEHQSWYYDVDKNSIFKFNPVPNMDEIRNIFEMKLRKKTWFI